MNAAVGSSKALRDEFVDRVAPLLFDGVEEAERPTMTLLVDPPGAGAGRVLSRLISEQRAAVVSAADLASFDESASEASAAAWLRMCLAHARDHHLPLVVQGGFSNPQAAFGTAQGFAEAGFQTRVATVVSPRPVSLLAVASTYLSAARVRVTAPLITVDDHDAGWSAARTLIRSLEPGDVDSLVLVDDTGASISESDGDDGVDQVGAAFDRARARALTALEATHWLSELRRLSEFAQARPTLPAEGLETLVAAHQMALSEVIPQLPVPAGSRVSAELERRVASRLVALRGSVPVPTPVVPAPVVRTPVPESTGPSR
ncbi:zeta toxin family protein [Microbacterium sp. NPDC055357]